MCLNINLNLHQFEGKVIKPKEVDEDITVYKLLIRRYRGFIMETPYVGMSIYFDGGKYTCPAFSKDSFQSEELLKEDNGYHSYVSSDGIKIPGYFFHFYHIGVYKAIIPKGSYVYYGTNGDICSNRLMILNERIETTLSCV